MKKNILFLFVIVMGFLASGCDFIYVPRSYYATIHNNEPNKYITAVYYRDAGYYNTDERWSKNQICCELYYDETNDLYLVEGTYDFKVIMEDDYYSYTIYQEIILLNGDVYIDFCVCDKNPNTKIVKTPKKELTEKKQATNF